MRLPPGNRIVRDPSTRWSTEGKPLRRWARSSCDEADRTDIAAPNTSDTTTINFTPTPNTGQSVPDARRYRKLQ
jgi:hypothetical protein